MYEIVIRTCLGVLIRTPFVVYEGDDLSKVGLHLYVDHALKLAVEELVELVLVSRLNPVFLGVSEGT